MAENMKFDLVSPERSLVSGEASAVQIPGTDGDLTVMYGHAPVITTLRPGILRVEGPKGEEDYLVSGGFAEINGDGLTVLAERAVRRDEMHQELFNDWVAEARDAKAKADEFKNEPGPVDDAAKLLSDMVALGTHIGLDPNQTNLGG
ncbi:F0F1 ATP synthase subunit epsilon [Pseudooceanicola sp. LIPI14-2-Ac024]|uniref:F0F1 ATP synthase subunit epsilon n=1 Tax=Pseudooceanicola sp. LIPI14-2-Ac024 TaxID=3344875 RepID=UPI0035CFCF9C